MAKLPDHGGGGLSSRATQRDRIAGIVLGDDLDPSVAGETLKCFGRQDRSVLGLRVASSRQGVERRVDHDGRPVRVGVGGDALGTQRHQGIGAACFDEDPLGFDGHVRDLIDDPLERLRDDRHPARTACVPRGRTGVPRLRTSTAGNGSARTPWFPPAQPAPRGPRDDGSWRTLYRSPSRSARPRSRLVANRHSSTTLSMPSTPVSSASVIPGRSWSARGGLDPPVRLPPRHPVADGEPVRHVSRARVLPCSPPIDLGDDAEQRHLRRGDVAIQRIGDADQPVVVQIGARDTTRTYVRAYGEVHHRAVTYLTSGEIFVGQAWLTREGRWW